MFEKKKFENDIFQDIQSFSDRIKNNTTEKNFQSLLPFGVSFLDDCLNGIRKNDLILIAAKTGFGKTELARIIALHNAIKHRVHFFALEAENSEIELRIKFTYMAQSAYGEFRKLFPQGFVFNYADWRDGVYNSNENLKNVVKDLSEYASNFVKDEYKNLKTYYQANSTLNEENIASTILSIKNETDLIIIDHLHYFGFSDHDENRAMKKLITTLRELSLKIEKPIVLLAHVRKTDRRNSGPIPTAEDIHGSSDISKIATKIILLARADVETFSNTKFATYFRVAKYRLDGSRTRYAAVVNFDISKNNYSEKYYLGKIKADESEIELFTEADRACVPHWAKNFVPAQSEKDSQKSRQSANLKPDRQKRVDIYE